jgi:hypothetical protein
MSVKLNNRYQIKTAEGFKDFDGIQKTLKNSVVRISLVNGDKLSCSENHLLFTDRWMEAKKLKVCDKLKLKNGWYSCISEIKIEKILTEFYEPLNVENSEYLSNGIVSHNCHFLSSSNTLIDGYVLERLVSETPIPDLGGKDIKIYETPRPDLMYFTMVDTSHGLGGDYSAIVVVEASKIPYRVVATYRNNKISPLLLPEIIFRISKYYHDALALIETNDVGLQVATILKHDLEYENCFMSKPQGKMGQIVSTALSNQTTPGVRTTKQVKRIGCANLKTLIETDRLIINDFHIKNELSTFVSDGSSYNAVDGHNDDLVMCLVLFAWLTNQPLFKELTDIDIRKNLYDDNLRIIEEELTPFGIIDDGHMAEFEFWPKDELDPITPFYYEPYRF